MEVSANENTLSKYEYQLAPRKKMGRTEEEEEEEDEKKVGGKGMM